MDNTVFSPFHRGNLGAGHCHPEQRRAEAMQHFAVWMEKARKALQEHAQSHGDQLWPRLPEAAVILHYLGIIWLRR